MAKCRKCGKNGLFLKVSESGLCADCQAEVRQSEKASRLRSEIEQLEKRRLDEKKLLEEAMERAKAQAHRVLEAQLEHLKREEAGIVDRIDSMTGIQTELEAKNAKLQKENAALARRIEKLRPAVDSIKDIQKMWVGGYELDDLLRLIPQDLNELLPQPDLNCLTIKELKSRYNALRKQIVEVCTAYEARYTTKSNAAMYKLMVLAMEAELENVLHKLQFGKLETGIEAVKEMTGKYYAITAEGNQSIAPTLKRFIAQIEQLYLQVVETEYEYFVQRERAREEQRAIKEQMRQEAEERKRLEQESKQVEAEEKKYQQEIDRITAQLQQAHDEELEKLRSRLEEVRALMDKVEAKKTEIIKLQNGKAGTVYIISNIGSFGDNVFKVGMTRRLEPQERVNELGDASVPFPFDVHSFIFSDDAVALETALHHELNDRRVNKVNLRKEFFNISIEELQALVERIDPTAPFRMTALAEQYRQSLSIDDVPVVQQYFDEEE